MAGSRASVWLYCINVSTGGVSQEFWRVLDAALMTIPPQPIALTIADGSETNAQIPIGEFVKRQYFFTVPDVIHGSLILNAGLVNGAALSVTLDIQEPTPGGKQAQQRNPPASGKELVAKESPLFGGFLNRRVSPYEPIYFIAGTHPSIEFQFSLKARLFNTDKEDTPFGDVFFGYTQTSYWDLFTPDPKFTDTSYKPSFFFLKHDAKLPKFVYSDLKFDMQYGYEHESNGDGDRTERSLNTIYFQPTITFGKKDKLHLTLEPRIWYYLSLSPNNSDLAQYRGHVNLRTALTWQSVQFATRLEAGDRLNHAGTQLDLIIDLRRLNLKWDPSLQFEYFTGYGQYLLDYNKNDTGLRAGFNLWYPRYDGR